jgi:hypothetical protein
MKIDAAGIHLHLLLLLCYKKIITDTVYQTDTNFLLRVCGGGRSAGTPPVERRMTSLVDTRSRRRG